MDQERLTDQTFFTTIDVARMANDMALTAKGETRGAKNLPPEGTTMPDEIEAAIIQEIYSIRTRTVQDAQLRLNSINKLMAQDRANVGTSVLDTEISPIVTRLELMAFNDIIDLENTNQQLEEQKADFVKWRKRRKLERPATETKSAFSFFADLFLLAILEGGMNLFFFMENNALGMLGAFMQAFIIAGANILLCVVAGFVLLKRVNSVFILNKTIGFLAILTLITALPFVHGIIGFYRIARRDLASNDLSQTIEQIAPQTGVSTTELPQSLIPLDITELSNMGTSHLWTAIDWMMQREFYRLDEMSIIMCIIGVVLGAYAARKGYEFGDRYPDYSKNFKHFESRRLNHLDHLDEITENMLADQSKAASGIQTFLTKLSSTLGSLENYQSKKTELAVNLRNFESHLADVARRLLAEYRNANKSTRTAAAPPSFLTEFVFSEPLFDGERINNPELSHQLRKNSAIEIESQHAANTARSSAQTLQQKIDSTIKVTRKVLLAGSNFREGN